ncbi:aquaporin [Candidatus Saccharibacteria bacterium]|nr:aquaporin [Candidatus Saccharibacteria bacterium]
MAKSKKSSKKQSPSSKAEKVVKDEAVKTEKVEKAEKTEKAEKKVEKKKKGFFGKLFERKFDANENILTIFKNKKIYAALIGEILGTMVLCMVLLTLGVYQPLYILFVLVAIMVAVYAFSGANLNPIVTVGMMVTRRMSAIRGVLYLLAQLVGAWLGQLVILGFLNGSGAEAEMPAMAEVADGMFWHVTMLEFVGAIIIAFFFARALQYKRSVFTFAAVAAGGVMIAFVVVYLLSYNYFELTNNFILNPAIAFMHQILPNEAEGFGELMGKVALALLTYVIFPVIGGAIGFLISDAGSVLNEENVNQ